MENITIYRVEHVVDRIGPYQTRTTDVTIKALHDSHLYPETYRDYLRHPTIASDRGLQSAVLYIENDDMHFGFSSIDQLKSWFYHKDVLEWLHENGYVISVFTVHPSDCLIGWSQALFNISMAVRTKQYSIQEFIEENGILPSTEQHPRTFQLSAWVYAKELLNGTS